MILGRPRRPRRGLFFPRRTLPVSAARGRAALPCPSGRPGPLVPNRQSIIGNRQFHPAVPRFWWKDGVLHGCRLALWPAGGLPRRRRRRDGAGARRLAVRTLPRPLFPFRRARQDTAASVVGGA